MFGLSLAETAVILLVAILVIGPKELPTVLRAGMKLLRQLRGIAGEYRKAFDEALKESEFADLHQEFKHAKTGTVIDLEGKPQPTYDISSELKHDEDRKTKRDASNDARA